MDRRAAWAAILAYCLVITFPSIAQEVVTPFSFCFMRCASHVEINKAKVKPKAYLAHFDQALFAINWCSQWHEMEIIGFVASNSLELSNPAYRQNISRSGISGQSQLCRNHFDASRGSTIVFYSATDIREFADRWRALFMNIPNSWKYFFDKQIWTFGIFDAFGLNEGGRSCTLSCIGGNSSCFVGAQQKEELSDCPKAHYGSQDNKPKCEESDRIIRRLPPEFAPITFFVFGCVFFGGLVLFLGYWYVFGRRERNNQCEQRKNHNTKRD